MQKENQLKLGLMTIHLLNLYINLPLKEILLRGGILSQKQVYLLVMVKAQEG